MLGLSGDRLSWRALHCMNLTLMQRSFVQIRSVATSGCRSRTAYGGAPHPRRARGSCHFAGCCFRDGLWGSLQHASECPDATLESRDRDRNGWGGAQWGPGCGATGRGRPPSHAATPNVLPASWGVELRSRDRHEGIACVAAAEGEVAFLYCMLSSALVRLWNLATAIEMAGGVHNGARDASLQAAIYLPAIHPPPMCYPQAGIELRSRDQHEGIAWVAVT
jgi:hypothetical protein